MNEPRLPVATRRPEGNDGRRRLLPGRLDQPVDAARQHPVAFVGGVLVAQRCLLGRVAEPTHDLLGARSRGRCERAGDVTQIVQVKAWQTDRASCAVPVSLPHPGSHALPALPDKHQSAWLRGYPPREVRLDPAPARLAGPVCVSPLQSWGARPGPRPASTPGAAFERRGWERQHGAEPDRLGSLNQQIDLTERLDRVATRKLDRGADLGLGIEL